MGLDQYAYRKTPETGEEGDSPAFVWRKHAKLQTFMEHLYTARTGLDASNLNCGELRLYAADIDRLETAAKAGTLPVCAGGGSACSRRRLYVWRRNNAILWGVPKQSGGIPVD